MQKKLLLIIIMVVALIIPVYAIDVTGPVTIIYPGYYNLKNDVLISTDGISINANDVIFDGNGHKFTGTRIGYGINIAGQNVTIKNTNISNWTNGIYCIGNENFFINNILIDNQGYGISSTGNNNTISNNLFNKNGNGIETSGNNYTISNNAVSENNDGIYIHSIRDSIVINNTIDKNNNGLDIYNDNFNDIIDSNNISSNIVGINCLYGNSNILITNNRVSQNSQSGINIGQCYGNHIYNNYFNNFLNANSGGTDNIWNSTKSPGPNINGGPYIGGNIWAKPDGTGFSQTQDDINGDGIAIFGYSINVYEIDYLPLLIPKIYPLSPIASFTVTPTSGIAPLGVTFTDTSTNTPTAWNWSFRNVTGNDTQIWFSTSQNPSHTFGIGNYSIALSASNSAGYNLSTQVTFINVTSPPFHTVLFITSIPTHASVYINNIPHGWTPIVFDDIFPYGNYQLLLQYPGYSDWSQNITLDNNVQTVNAILTPLPNAMSKTGVYRHGAGFYLKMDNGSTWNPSTDKYLAWDNAGIDLPIAGDWNADGRTETGVYRPGAGFYLKMDNGSTWTPSTDVYLAWDNAGIDLPVVGDWNADGRTETGVYRPGAGFYLKMDNGSTWNPSTDMYLAWDNAAIDRPVAGDWNADGRTETGVYRPGSGFYLKMDNGSNWNPSSDVYLAWDNAAIDRPVAGDWNADGRTETGVYRPGAGFYLKMDNGSTWNPSTDVYLAWDNANVDLPIAGNFV